MNANVVVAIEKDGVWWRLRFQRRYWNTCNVNYSRNSPTNIVEVQVGRANRDSDIVRRCTFLISDATYHSIESRPHELASGIVEVLALVDDVVIARA